MDWIDFALALIAALVGFGVQLVALVFAVCCFAAARSETTSGKDR